MADLEKLVVTIEADTKKLKSELAEVSKKLKASEAATRRTGAAASKSFKGASVSAKGLGASIKAAFLPLLAAGAAIAGIGKITGAWQTQEKAVNSLNAALQASGKFSVQASTAIQQEASRIQGLTTAGDEALIQATATIAQLTNLDDKGLVDIQSAIVGIADTFTGGNLESAALLVGKSIGSTTNALTRYGIQLDSNATQQEKLNSILQQSAKFFEVSKQNADTLQGRFAQLSNASGDVSEKIGAIIVEGINLKGVYKDLTDNTQRWNKFLEDNANLLANVINDIGAVVKAVVGLTVAIIKTVGAILKFIASLKAVQVAGDIFKKVLSPITNGFAALKNIAFKGGKGLVDGLSDGVAGSDIGNVIQQLQKDLARNVNVDLTGTARVRTGGAPLPTGGSDVSDAEKKAQKKAAQEAALLAVRERFLEATKQISLLEKDSTAIDQRFQKENQALELQKIALDGERADLELLKQKKQITEAQFNIANAEIDQRQRAIETEQQLLENKREQQQIELELKRTRAEQVAEIQRITGELVAQGATQREIDIAVGETELKYQGISEKLLAQLETLGLTKEQILEISGALDGVAAKATAAGASSSKLGDSAQAVQNAFKQAGDTLASSIGGAIKDGEFKLKDFASSILDTFLDLAKQLATTGLLKAITGGIGGGLGGGIGLPFRASGGPVEGGSPYIVGEKGPELFVPNSSGSIMKNSSLRNKMNAMNQGNTVYNNVTNIQAIDVKSFEDRLKGSQRLIGDIGVGAVQKRSNKTLQRSTME